MAKVKELMSTGALRTGNTIATPFRIVGEGGNALANVLRQGKSSVKNTAEIGKQTVDALIDNFLNFSKVNGKRYQRLTKGTINAISACTRRPFMIAGAGMLSGINQGIRKPFQKLLYTPGKMFKGMRNATRIFSKKKGFDFQTYDTHETGGDTRVNQFKEKKRGFLGAKKGSSETPVEKKVEKIIQEEKKSESKTESTPVEEKKVEEKERRSSKIEEKKSESKPEAKQVEKSESKSSSIDELKQKYSEEAEAKDFAEAEKQERKSLDRKEKAKQEKEFRKLLNNDMSEEGIIERAKKNKKGEHMEEILAIVKKESPTFAGYIEDEILTKKAPASATA